MNAEQEFLTHLDLIEEVIRFVIRQRRLRGADAEDFASHVKVRLIENDYGVLRKFEGRASFRTYLTTVINRIAFDYRREEQGKWRASAAAKRLGPVALRLEELIYRDGRPVQEAVTLLGSDPTPELSSEQLRDLAVQLPVRHKRRFEGEDAAEDGADAGVAGYRHSKGARQPLHIAPAEGEDRLVRREKDSRREKILEVLARCRDLLKGEDVLLLRLRYEEGWKVVDVAAALNQETTVLYRRLRKLKGVLRRHLEAEGITAQDLEEIFD